MRSFSPPLLFALVVQMLSSFAFGDPHPVYTFDWMMAEADFVAIVRIEYVKRVPLAESDPKEYAKFVTTLAILKSLKTQTKTESINLVHYRWAKENEIPLANPRFCKLAPALLEQLDSLDIGQQVDISSKDNLMLVFLKKRETYYEAVTKEHESYAIQRLVGNIDRKSE